MAYLAAGLLVKLRHKLAAVREGYYCYDDHQTGQLRFAATNASDEVRSSPWTDWAAQLPPFAAQIDIDFLSRKGLSRTEAGEYLTRTGNLYRDSSQRGAETLGLRSDEREGFTQYYR